MRIPSTHCPNISPNRKTYLATEVFHLKEALLTLKRGRWGVTGKHTREKVRLLKDEGVKVDAAGGRLKGSPWSGFR